MADFSETFNSHIHGILHGFDRIIINDHIPHLLFYGNNFYFLNQDEIKFIDFKDYVIKVSTSI